MDLPKISINIAVKKEENASIVLNSLQHVRYPEELIEILLIRGNHLTRQRNKGIKHSTGEIVYLLDNDSEVHPGALKLIAKSFLNPRVAAVGGPSLSSKQSSYFSTVVGYILSTYFGAFRMRFRYSADSQKTVAFSNEYSLIGCNLALRKNSVEKVGYFDEKFKANDETELLRRLKNAGYTLFYLPKLYVKRQQRPNMLSLAKQFHHYGKGRMQHLLKSPKYEDVFLLAPIGFMGYISILPFYRSKWFVIPLIIYCILGILTSLKAAIKHKRPDLLLIMNILFPIIHVSYGIGLIQEFFREHLTSLNKHLKQNPTKLPRTRMQVLKVQLVGSTSTDFLNKNKVI